MGGAGGGGANVPGPRLPKGGGGGAGGGGGGGGASISSLTGCSFPGRQHTKQQWHMLPYLRCLVKTEEMLPWKAVLTAWPWAARAAAAGSPAAAAPLLPRCFSLNMRS